MTAIYTCVTGDNAALFEHMAPLYIYDGDTVVDVTYGKGVFWRKVDTSRFTLLASDLDPRDHDHVSAMELGRTTYEDKSADVFVLDPPYMHTPGKPIVDGNYKNRETTGGMYHGDIMAGLYFRGMAEARRVLKLKGRLMVKCQDEIQSGKQVWSHIEIYNAAVAMGFYAKDLFVLSGRGTRPQHKQQHARRNHSYLWVFERNPA